MTRHHAALFSDLERHSSVWVQTSRENAIAILSEYRYLAEALAAQFGAIHQNFTGDGHLFLFRDADAAVDFGIALAEQWQRCYETIHVLREAPRIALRLGCHFGECFALGDEWVGRGISLAKRVETAAPANTLCVSENVLELLDIARFEFEHTGEHILKGDYLPRRALYKIRPKARRDVGARDQPETAETVFLSAVHSSAPDEEERLLRRALELRVDYPEAHNNLAIVLRRKGNLGDAAEHYREALRLRPEYPEAHSNYAYLLEALGRLDGAIDHAEQAVRLRPDYVEGHHRLANLLAAQGELDRAVTHYEKTLDLRPTYAEAHNNLAIVHELRGHLELAEVHYKQAIRMKPDYAPALYNYGLLLEEIGAPERATDQYRRALEIWPDYPEAHNNLAAQLHRSGEFSEAEIHYRAAIRLRPNDPEPRHNLGLLLKSCGRHHEAEQQFEAARELLPAQSIFISSIETPD